MCRHGLDRSFIDGSDYRDWRLMPVINREVLAVLDSLKFKVQTKFLTSRSAWISRGFREWDGGADRNRTCDLLIANETLYQLSYDPIPTHARAGIFVAQTRRGRNHKDSWGRRLVRLLAVDHRARQLMIPGVRRRRSNLACWRSHAISSDANLTSLGREPTLCSAVSIPVLLLSDQFRSLKC